MVTTTGYNLQQRPRYRGSGRSRGTSISSRTITRRTTEIVCEIAGQNLKSPLSLLNGTVSADAAIASEKDKLIGHACRRLKNSDDMYGKFCVARKKRCKSLDEKIASCVDAGAVGVFLVLEGDEAAPANVNVSVPDSFPVIVLDDALAVEGILPLLETDIDEDESRVFQVGAGVDEACF